MLCTGTSGMTYIVGGSAVDGSVNVMYSQLTLSLAWYSTALPSTRSIIVFCLAVFTVNRPEME